MKRTIIYFLCVLLGVAVGIFIGTRINPLVEIQIKNKSTRNIEAIHIKHEHGNELVENIRQGETRVVTIYARGETSYSMIATFSDGKQLTGGEEYAESGYKISETITDNQIKSDFIHP